jgi:hypothetical protein
MSPQTTPCTLELLARTANSEGKTIAIIIKRIVEISIISDKPCSPMFLNGSGNTLQLSSAQC